MAVVTILSTAALAVVLSPTLCDADDAAVPAAPKLLPETTLAYLRIENADELRGSLSQSSLAKMLDDPKMRPFVSDFYQTAADAFATLAADWGITLDQLLDIPHGQVAVAMIEGVPTPNTTKIEPSDAETEDEQIRTRLRRRREEYNSFAVVVIVDAGDRAQDVRRLLSSTTELAEKNQFVSIDESIGGATLHRLKRSQGSQTFEWFEQNGCFVAGVGHESAGALLRRLRPDPVASETPTPSLAENNDFAAVMSRVLGAEADAPQITFFVNPYGIVKRLISRSDNAFFVWPIVQELGLEKIRGVGGSIFRGVETVENLSHVYVLLDPPRDGLFGVIRPGEGATQPPDWVPADASAYLSVWWDFETTYKNLAGIVEKFAGEGQFDRFLEVPIKNRLDVSVRDDLIANLTGRYVHMTRHQRPAAWNSQASINAFQVRDPAKLGSMIETIRGKLPPEDFRPEVIGGTTVYFGRERSRDPRPGFRKQERCLAVMNDWLVLADSREVIQQALRARDGNLPQLVAHPDYAYLTAELGSKIDGERPFWISFSRDAEIYRPFYEQAATSESSSRLRMFSKDGPVGTRFADLLERNALPAFETMSQYFGVSGTFGINEPDGIHFGWMNLRPVN